MINRLHLAMIDLYGADAKGYSILQGAQLCKADSRGGKG